MELCLGKWNDGWVIDDPKEWAFVLIILTFIPLWLTSWAALSLIPWGKIFLNVILFPMRAFRSLFYKPVKIIAKTAGVPVVKKKKSYKEIRPRGTRAPITDYSDPVRPGVLSASAKPAAPAKPAAKKEEPAVSPTFDHSLFKFDEDTDDDFDFDFDSFDKKFSDAKPAEAPKEEPKETPKPAPAKSKNSKDKKTTPSAMTPRLPHNPARQETPPSTF